MRSSLRRLGEYQQRLGVLDGTRWWAIRAADFRGLIHRKDVEVKVPGSSRRVRCRMHGSSDPDAFDEIFIKRELDHALNLESPKFIIDLGANVGYASLFFLNAFPDAHVIAVEPEPGNVEMCRLNLAPYSDRARVIQGAVWHRRGRLVLSKGNYGDGREWATQVREARPGEHADIEAWDIPSLIDLCAGKKIDLLKIDIEGAEQELFSRGCDRWLSQVRSLCIEMHGPECEKAVLDAMRSCEYELKQDGQWVSWFLNVRAGQHHFVNGGFA